MLTQTSDGTVFVTGRMRFLDEDPGSPEKSHKIYVKIEPGDFGSFVLAQLDTGAAWSILDPQIAEELALFDGQGQPITLDTRFGPISGHLERTKITILADEGESVEFESDGVCFEAVACGQLSRIRRIVRASSICNRSTTKFFLLRPRLAIVRRCIPIALN